MEFEGDKTYRAARSLCTTFIDSKYFIPDAICVAIYIKQPYLEQKRGIFIEVSLFTCTLFAKDENTRLLNTTRCYTPDDS